MIAGKSCWTLDVGSKLEFTFLIFKNTNKKLISVYLHLLQRHKKSYLHIFMWFWWHVFLKNLTELSWIFYICEVCLGFVLFDITFRFVNTPMRQAPAEFLVTVSAALWVHIVSCLNIIGSTVVWQGASGSQTFPVDTCQVVDCISLLKGTILR